MPNTLNLKEEGIKEALQMLYVLDQTYSIYSTPVGIDLDLCDYYGSLQNEDWINPLNGKGNRYGAISQKGDKLRICFHGISSNIWTFMDCLRLNYDQTFYGIQSFVSSTVARFYSSLHYQIQNALLTNPQITKIQIVGYSYGTALAQFTSVLIYKMIRFHKFDISPEGNNTISAIYSNYLIPYLNQTIGKYAYDPLSKAIRTASFGQSLGQKSFLETAQDIDRGLFNRIELDCAHLFSPVQVFTDPILTDPDLGLLQSSSAFNLGNPIQGDFLNRIFSYIMPNDPIPSLLDKRTFFGKMVSNLDQDTNRCLIGKVIITRPNSFLPMHTNQQYVISLSKSLKTLDSLQMYSCISFPVTQPFPLFVLPYLGIAPMLGVPAEKTPFNLIAGSILFLIGIFVPLAIGLVLLQVIILILRLQRII